MTGHGDKVYALAVSPKDGSIASGDTSGEIRLWDWQTGRGKWHDGSAQKGACQTRRLGWVSLRFSARMGAHCYPPAVTTAAMIPSVSTMPRPASELTAYAKP